MAAEESATAAQTPPAMHVDVAIVGAGLSGLAVAYGLGQDEPSSQHDHEATSLPWVLLEAREDVGGRVANAAEDCAVDMGGAWMWPGQDRVRMLARQVGAATFPQPDDKHGYAPHRVVGGAYAMAKALRDALPAERVRCGYAVLTVRQRDSDDGGGAILTLATGEEVFARRVVLAVPPKMLLSRVTFSPPLSATRRAVMDACETWMAGVTKVALVFENRFWLPDDEGLTNLGLRPSSARQWPAFQVYDASTADGSVAALTLFALADSLATDKQLAIKCAEQLAATWHAMGLPEHAAQVTRFNRFYCQRWPRDPWISDNPNPDTIHPHPHPRPALAEPAWGATLFFASTETDLKTPGLMDGAVGAAHRVLEQLKQ